MHWGTKLVLGLATFITFIMGMVIYMFMVHGNDALVDNDYYEKGINYNQEYTAKQNVLNDLAEPKIIIHPTIMVIEFKDSAQFTLRLMRPSSEKEDVKVAGNTVGDRHAITLNTQKMHRGLWFMELNWISNGKPYMLKKNLTL